MTTTKRKATIGTAATTLKTSAPASSKTVKLPSGGTATVKTPSKSVQKRVMHQLDLGDTKLSDADVQRIVRAMQCQEANSIRASNSGEVGLSLSKTLSVKTLSPSVPATLDELGGVLAQLRSAFGDLTEKLNPILGPQRDEDKCGEAIPRASTSAVQERLEDFIRDAQHTINWINAIRERVEL